MARLKFNYRGITELSPAESTWTNHLDEVCYYWNWEGGGYNSLWAKDLKHLKQKIAKEFANSSLKVDWSTVKAVNEAEYDRRNRSAYLSTI